MNLWTIARDVFTRRTRAGVALFVIFAALWAGACNSKEFVVSKDASHAYCPVCKMKVSSDDKLMAEIHYNDGMKLMFESAGDMLMFYNTPDRYGVPEGRCNRANIERVVMKDYQTLGRVDARQAALVYKSKINGPMGPDVFAFARREDAEAFAAENGGTVTEFDALTPEMVKDLRKR